MAALLVRLKILFKNFGKFTQNANSLSNAQESELVPLFENTISTFQKANKKRDIIISETQKIIRQGANHSLEFSPEQLLSNLSKVDKKDRGHHPVII